MPRQTQLAQFLRDAGVNVREYDGWKSRGNSSFSPRGVVCHHTGPYSTEEGMVSLCVRGRSDLPGPLANVVLKTNGEAVVIAAGRANHAGTGGWRDLSGNSSVYGIEAINPGDWTPWPDVQIDAYEKICAAMCRDMSRGSEWVCAHREWTYRKPDPRGIEMNVFRAAVSHVLAPPPPPPQEGVVVVNKPPIRRLDDPQGRGYWIITNDGGVFTFAKEGQELPFYGSLGGITLNSSIIDAGVTTDGGGYWMMGGDGGLFQFGNAQYNGRVEYRGTMGALRRLVGTKRGKAEIPPRFKFHDENLLDPPGEKVVGDLEREPEKNEE